MGRQDTRICGGGFDSSGSEQGHVAGSFEHGKERRNSIQGVEFLDSLTTIDFSSMTQLQPVDGPKIEDKQTT